MTDRAMSDQSKPTCRLCGTVLKDVSQSCPACGAMHGEASRCPHCGSIANVEPSAAFGYRCRICGGPRVVLDDRAVRRTDREVPLLQQAKSARNRALVARFAGALLGGVGLLGVMLTLLLVVLLSLSTPSSLLLALLLAVLPMVLAAVAWMRGRHHDARKGEALQQARVFVAADALSSRGEIGASELAKLMRLSQAESETVLNRLNLEDFVTSRVTPEGDVVYSTRSIGRLRVTEGEETGLEDALLPDADAAARAEPRNT